MTCKNSRLPDEFLTYLRFGKSIPMPLKEHVLQRQLARAQAHLSTVEKRMEKVEQRKHAKWRRAQARIDQIQARLASRAGSAGSGEAAAEEA
ncbi:hypothetical protein [Planctomicrobium sp. SH664]|uniref:hypothetical protein n=1 Tax=Planctomicrobium sp. SH664 TaxID=3448125 RepID=UPI003F5B5C74